MKRPEDDWPCPDFHRSRIIDERPVSVGKVALGLVLFVLALCVVLFAMLCGAIFQGAGG